MPYSDLFHGSEFWIHHMNPKHKRSVPKIITDFLLENYSACIIVNLKSQLGVHFAV